MVLPYATRQRVSAPQRVLTTAATHYSIQKLLRRVVGRVYVGAHIMEELRSFFAPAWQCFYCPACCPWSYSFLFFFDVHLLTNHSRHIFQSSVCCVRIRFLASHRSDIVCVCQDLFLTNGYGSLSACGTLGLVAFVVFVHWCNVQNAFEILGV